MAVAANYKKSFRLLIDRDMKKKEFAEKNGVSIATITKMGKGGTVDQQRGACENMRRPRPHNG